jgi:hypothetical protein
LFVLYRELLRRNSLARNYQHFTTKIIKTNIGIKKMTLTFCPSVNSPGTVPSSGRRVMMEYLQEI